MNIFKKVAKKVKGIKNKAINDMSIWDMSTPESREKQIMSDFEFAKRSKYSRVEDWKVFDNYYRGKHKSSVINQLMEANGQTPIEIPSLTDCFIQVESQIDPNVPSFQFSGRDTLSDEQTVKIREKLVKYICYNNKIDRLNVDNERYLNKLGNAFWKVSFDYNKRVGKFKGDIVIGNPSPANIFPDPSAQEIDDCEYIDYVFRIHRRKARRLWGEQIDEILNDANHGDTEIFDDRIRNVDDDTVQVIEHWFRDDEGDIACSILVAGKEVQFIEKFWEKTKDSGNQRYPFIKYCKIPMDQSFWDISEIETIKNLVDGSDIEFTSALLNDMMMSNDNIIVEEEALKEGQEISNMPGSVIYMKQNKINSIRRMGGVSSNINNLNVIDKIHDKIEETTGNSAANQGIEPSRVTTASGIAQINEKNENRKSLKKYDRLKGFEELFKLIDLMIIEFFDDNRTVIIKGENKLQQPQEIQVNSERLLNQDGYYTDIDCEVTAGDGIAKSKAFTMQVMSDLINTPITPQNVELVKQYVEVLDLPNAEEIKAAIDQGLGLQDMMNQLQQGGGMAGVPQGNMPMQQGSSPLPQQQPQQGDIIDQVVGSLNPAELKILQNASPEQQQAIIKNLIGGMSNGKAKSNS